MRGRLATATIVGATAAVVAGTLGAGVAAATTYDTAPSAGAPFFNQTHASEIIRGSGSDTTFFMMQKIGDLYTAAGLYGCTLNSGTGATLFEGNDYSGSLTDTGAASEDYCLPASADSTTADVNDNWNRVEVLQGVNDVGSGAGQKQLGGKLNAPDAVDFSRSSKPYGSSNFSTGSFGQQLGYAKDGVPLVTFPTINPSTFGTASFSSSQEASNAYPAGAYNTINGGHVGPVADGWLPGDNVNGTANNGSELVGISNVGGAGSIASRLYCENNSTQITDWGQLTNLGPNLEIQVTPNGTTSPTVSAMDDSVLTSIPGGSAVSNTNNDSGVVPSSTTVSSTTGTTITLNNVLTGSGPQWITINIGSSLAEGSGASIGVPIRIVGVNNASGTVATWSGYADSGVSGNCAASATLSNLNAANDPNASTIPASGPYSTNPSGITAREALENNVHQLELFSQADFGPTDYADQAVEEATSLYFMSNGVYNSNPYVAETTIDGQSFSAFEVALNGVEAGTSVELNNHYPTARTLSNIINPVTVRLSTAGFMNWICDAGVSINKATDLNNGLNEDAELSNIISTQFGFPRIDDLTAPVSLQPPDEYSSTNDDCAAKAIVTNTGGTITELANSTSYPVQTLGGNFPTDLVTGEPVVTSAGLYVGNVAAGSAGTGTLTLTAGTYNSVASTTLPNGTFTLDFLGVPAVFQASTTP